MARVYVNKIALRQTFERQKGPFINAIDAKVIPILEAEKQQLLSDIENDPTSKELTREGELFGFIGFDKLNLEGFDQQDPVGDLLDTIDETTQIPTTASNISFIGTQKVNARYKVEVTSLDDLEENDKLKFPWGLHSNWVIAIEKGISGLTNFLIGNKSGSRSEGGLQSKYKTGRGEYQPRQYFSSIIKKFVAKINNASSYVTTRYNIRNALGRFTKLF